MENVSLPDDVWSNVTTSSSVSEEPERYFDTAKQLTIKTIYLIIGSVGVLDNLFVVVVFAMFIKITEKTMNILIVNQSIIDLATSVFLILTSAIRSDRSGMSHDSVWDQFVCRFWIPTTPLWCMLATSTYGILLMAFDRYSAVIYPIWYSQNIKVKKRLAFGSVAFIWIAMPTFVIMMLAMSNDVIGGTCTILVDFRMKSNVLILVIMYVLPVMLMIPCYARIVYTLRKKVGAQGSSAANAAVGRNALVTSLMICSGFFICWTPNTIYFPLGKFGTWFYHFTVFLAFTNSCINPLIYAAKYREFRQGVRRLAVKLHCERNQVATSSA